MRSQHSGILLAVGSLLLMTSLISVQKGSAEPAPQGISNGTCLECHGDPELTMQLENGEVVSLYLEAEAYNDSVHGKAGYACVQCHTTVGDYPHPVFRAQDRRDVSIRLYTACFSCHPGQYQDTLDSAHDDARAAGNREAAICTDCHGAHTTRRLTKPETGKLLEESRIWIPQTCARCHNAIYERYRSSVHGSALIGAGNPDVPTCIDCHGVHRIEDPTTSAFRLRSPQICAECHTDSDLMAKYGLSTQVLQTYVADFHGTTVTLFEKQSPDAETNKPVCFDCHGVHDIRRVDDPQKGIQVKENLLSRCQICHPEATIGFSEAWLSHYIPSSERNPLVFYVNQFYKFFIPGVLGGMALLVALDASWRLRKRMTQRRMEQIQAEEENGPEIIDFVPGERGTIALDQQTDVIAQERTDAPSSAGESKPAAPSPSEDEPDASQAPEEDAHG